MSFLQGTLAVYGVSGVLECDGTACCGRYEHTVSSKIAQALEVADFFPLCNPGCDSSLHNWCNALIQSGLSYEHRMILSWRD